MAVINKYTAHTIEPDILSRLNVDQAGDVVSAETWVALWDLVLHLLAKYNEHFVDIYRTLEELGTEVDTCIKRIDSLEDQYQSLEERMGNLETSWSALQDAYNKVAGHYEEIKHIQESLESGFVHYGKEPPATDFIKLWVMPTQGIPSLITSWGEDDILATNYNYASAKLIKDSLNTKVNKAGDTMTGTLSFSGSNYQALYGGNPAYREWYINWDGDFKLWTGNTGALDVGGRLRVGGSQHSFTVNAEGSDPSVTLHNLRLTGLQHPIMPNDAAPRQYVDDTRDLNTPPSLIVNDWEYGRLYKTSAVYDTSLVPEQPIAVLQYRKTTQEIVNFPEEACLPNCIMFKTKQKAPARPPLATPTFDIITQFNGYAFTEVCINPSDDSVTLRASLKPSNFNVGGVGMMDSLEPSYSVYPTTALVKDYIDFYSDIVVKEYVDPKIADLEENKFRHTGYYKLLDTVTVDTPVVGTEYAMPYSLGLVEGVTYEVDCVTASNTLKRFNLIAEVKSGWDLPAGVLAMTDSEETPNVTIIDSCAPNWSFDTASSLFYSDSTAMRDDPIVRITVRGVNANVLTYSKLPMECLEIPDEFIDGHKLTKATVPLNRLKGPDLLETIEIPEGEVIDAIDINLSGDNKDYARYRLVGHLHCSPAIDAITSIPISLKSGTVVYQNMWLTLSEYDRAVYDMDVCFDINVEKEDNLVTITLDARTGGSGDYLTQRIVKTVSRIMNKITLTGPFRKANTSPELRCYGYNKLTE